MSFRRWAPPRREPYAAWTSAPAPRPPPPSPPCSTSPVPVLQPRWICWGWWQFMHFLVNLVQLVHIFGHFAHLHKFMHSFAFVCIISHNIKLYLWTFWWHARLATESPMAMRALTALDMKGEAVQQLRLGVEGRNPGSFHPPDNTGSLIIEGCERWTFDIKNLHIIARGTTLIFTYQIWHHNIYISLHERYNLTSKFSGWSYKKMLEKCKYWHQQS